MSCPSSSTHHGLVLHLPLPLLGCTGTDMMGKMLKMQMLEDEDDLAYETEKKERTSSTSDTQPAWMRTLHSTSCNWLQLMPQTVNPLKRTVENIKVSKRVNAAASCSTKLFFCIGSESTDTKAQILVLEVKSGSVHPWFWRICSVSSNSLSV